MAYSIKAFTFLPYAVAKTPYLLGSKACNKLDRIRYLFFTVRAGFFKPCRLGFFLRQPLSELLCFLLLCRKLLLETLRRKIKLVDICR